MFWGIVNNWLVSVIWRSSFAGLIGIWVGAHYFGVGYKFGFIYGFFIGVLICMDWDSGRMKGFYK
jgi:hypothetical protein